MMKSQVNEAKIGGIFDHYEFKYGPNFWTFCNSFERKLWRSSLCHTMNEMVMVCLDCHKKNQTSDCNMDAGLCI